MTASASDLVRQGGPLWQRICEFNFAASRRADSSRLPTVPQPLLERLNASPRATRRLSRQLLESEKIISAPWLNFSSQADRLALLDAPTLQRLVNHAGAAIYSDRLCRIIEGARLRELRQTLGADLLHFALHRAPFFHRPPAEIRSRHEACPEPIPELCQAVERAGQDCLELCLSGRAPGLAERFALRFAKGRAWKLEQTVDPHLRQKSWSFLHRLLVQEIAPESAAWLS